MAQPLINELRNATGVFLNGAESLTLYGVNLARRSYMASPAARGNMQTRGRAQAIFGILTSLGYAIQRLKLHGVVPFII